MATRHDSSRARGSHVLARLLAILGLALASSVLAAGSEQKVVPTPSEATMRLLLERGGWSNAAEDDRDGEVLPAERVRTIVEAAAMHPDDPQVLGDLALLDLALSVAEWGIAPVDSLPADPARLGWAAAAKNGDGKHLMSYARGGVGIAHMDVGTLARLFDYLKEHHPDVVPDRYREAFFRLRGVSFDGIYARGGNCTRPHTNASGLDLEGHAFGHRANPYAGDGYCETNLPRARTTVEDWTIFRHGMRAALRHEDVQFWILRTWVDAYWTPSLELVRQTPGWRMADVMINARIRNSSPAVARCAWDHARAKAPAEARIQAQLAQYAAAKNACGSGPEMSRRFGYLRRASVLLDALRPSSVAAGPSAADAPARPLPVRFTESDLYRARTSDRGDGDPALRGTRNFLPVLAGVVYRGGADNAGRPLALSPDAAKDPAAVKAAANERARNPLTDAGLSALCNAGFDRAVYLYRTHYESAQKSTACDGGLPEFGGGGAHVLQYDDLPAWQSPAAQRSLLVSIHDRLVSPPPVRPVFLHCWNGWHASGFVSALVLRQFCGMSGEAAKAYWKHTAAAPVASEATLLRGIEAFEPMANLAIPDEIKARVCPQP